MGLSGDHGRLIKWHQPDNFQFAKENQHDKRTGAAGNPDSHPGERITADIVNYIQYAKEKGCSLTGPQDMEIARLNMVKK